MEKIREPVSHGCGSEFHENKVIDTVVHGQPASIVFNVLSSHQVLQRVMAMKQARDLRVSGWKQRHDGFLEREVRYVMPVHVPLAPAKETEVIDVEMILSQGPQTFVLEKHSVAPKMPYSDDFVPMLRCCVVDQPQGAHLLVSVWIRWLYKPALVKKTIDKVTMDGLMATAQEYAKALNDCLQREE